MAMISNRSVWKAYGDNDITHSWGHYLTAIFALHEEQGYARLSDVANKLGISKGSLSTSLKPLFKKNLIFEDENKHLFLSEIGRKMAMRVQKAFSVVYFLLGDFLGLDDETAQIDACKLEHLLSEKSTGKLLQLVKALKANPELQKSILTQMNVRQNCNLKCIIAEQGEDFCTR